MLTNAAKVGGGGEDIGVYDSAAIKNLFLAYISDEAIFIFVSFYYFYIVKHWCKTI